MAGFTTYDLTQIVRPQNSDTAAVKLLRLVLAKLTGQIDSVAIGARSQPRKYTLSGSGVVAAGKKSLTFITHGTECSIFADPCTDGREYTYTATDGTTLESITYNAANGSTFEVLEIS